jgi:hypothetical protein
MVHYTATERVLAAIAGDDPPGELPPDAADRVPRGEDLIPQVPAPAL